MFSFFHKNAHYNICCIIHFTENVHKVAARDLLSACVPHSREDDNVVVSRAKFIS